MQIRCACGKSLRVADHLCGKKVRCPACSKTLLVPAASVPDAEILEVVASPRKLPWLYLGLAAGAMGLFACCGVGIGAFWIFNRTQEVVESKAPVSVISPAKAPIARAEDLPVVKEAPKKVEAVVPKKSDPPSPTPSEKIKTPKKEKAPVPKLEKDAGNGKDSYGLLFLEAPVVPAEPVSNTASGMLVQELFRQTVLLTAADYLGLTVRDATMGDLAPEGLPDDHRLRTRVGHNLKTLEMNTHVGNDPTKEPLWHHEMVIARPGDVTTLATLCETQARSELLTKLRSAGFKGKANPGKRDLEVPQEVEELLGQMTDTAQFQALRQLHALMKNSGESPLVLGAVARGYANLGVLTEYQWSSAPKAFKARALLYAQRLTRREPQSPWAAWHRAYVYALVGVHEAALRELAQAAKWEAEAKEKGDVAPTAKRPAWVDLIQNYCNFDTTRVKEAAKTPQLKQLADLLTFLTVEDLHNIHLNLEVGRDLLDYNGECYRVHDSLAGLGGVRNQHVTTLAGMDVFTKMFTKRVALMPGLPKSVAKLTDSGAGDPQVCKALVQASQSEADTNPLSWAVLGRLGQEIRFSQVCRRLDFMVQKWGVSTKEFVQEAMPLVAEHPYRDFVLTYALDKPRDKEALAKLIRALPPSFFETGQLVRIRVNSDFKGVVPQTLIDLYLATKDRIYRDVWFITDNLSSDQEKANYAQQALAISKNAPFAKAMLIKLNWPLVRGNADAWENDCQQPRVLYELGQRYYQLKRYDDAERCLQKSLTLSADLTNFWALAGCYKIRGKMDLWQQMLEACLKEEDTGLDHAQAQVEIANTLMKRKEWGKALPFAEAAAQTQAEWAMVCANECHTGLGNWAKAEQFIRIVSERYTGSYYKWYFWCQKTGKGNSVEADRYVSRVIDSIGNRAIQKDKEHFVGFYLISGRSQKAVDIFKEWYAVDKTDVLALQLAVVSDEAGDRKLRDQTLKDHAMRSGAIGSIIDTFQTALAKGENSPVDLAAVDEALKLLTAKLQSEFACVVARFLERHGQTRDAMEYYRRCAAASVQHNPDTQLLAVVRLRAIGKGAGKGDGK